MASNKLLITNKKNIIFLNNLKEDGYEVISYEKYIIEFIDNIFDIICINNNICNGYRNKLNQFQISELLNIINNYFGRHCIESSIITKYINKKIVVYDINYEDVKQFFLKYNYKEFKI